MTESRSSSTLTREYSLRLDMNAPMARICFTGVLYLARASSLNLDRLHDGEALTHPDPDKMVVVSVCVVPSLDPVQPPRDGTPFGVLAVIRMDEHRSLQLVATYEASGPFEQVRNEAMEAQKRRFGIGPGTVPDDAVAVLVRSKSDGTRWVTAALVWPYG